MDRRRFIRATMLLPVFASAGCPLLGLVARVGLRGGLLRASARAGRLSKRGALTSFGRATATSLHLARLMHGARAINTLKTIGEIYTLEDGEPAMTINSSLNICECLVDGAPIVATEFKPDSEYLDHYSFVQRAHIGYSEIKSDDVIYHYDEKNKFLGADIRRDYNVTHLDADMRKVGTSAFSVIEKSTTHVDLILKEDSHIADELEKTLEILRSDGKDLLIADKLMLQAQNECLSQSGACDDQAVRAQNALIALEKRLSK